MTDWKKPSKDGLLPRWKPSYGGRVEADVFLGYAGPFDVWFDGMGDGDHSVVAVVGPSKTKIVEGGGYNFDTFYVVENNLVRDSQEDLHIGLEDMCLIYQRCVENNIVREDPNAETVET